jgi:RNA polymerase sigma-70 factor (ECF subfamily)
MELKLIINECKQQRLTAQKCLFDLFATQMFLLCKRYLKNTEVAEEVLMNGFVQVYKSLHKFNYADDASTISWIKKIMVNECLQELRKKQSFLTVAANAIEDKTIDNTVFEKISTEEIYQLIAQLPTGYRTVFNLFEIEGYSHKEIASNLKISEGTSKSQLSRAKQMLQDFIIKNNQVYATKSN